MGAFVNGFVLKAYAFVLESSTSLAAPVWKELAVKARLFTALNTARVGHSEQVDTIVIER